MICLLGDFILLFSFSLFIEQLYLVKEPSDGTFQEGSAITIQCSAVGFPYPRYQWFHIFKTRDDSSVTKKLSDGVDKVLKIAKLKQEDSGGYFCQIYHILPDRSRPQMHTKVAYISVTPSYNSKLKKTEVVWPPLYKLLCIFIFLPAKRLEDKTMLLKDQIGYEKKKTVAQICCRSFFIDKEIQLRLD